MRRNWKSRNQRANKKPRPYKNTLRARRERHQARHPNDKSHMTSNFATEFDTLKARANKITAEHIIVNTKGEPIVYGQSAGEAHELLDLYAVNQTYVAVGSKAGYYLYDRTDDGFNMMLTYTTTVRKIKKQANKRVSEPVADAFRVDELTAGERYRKMQEFGRMSTTTVKDLKEECRVLGLKVSGKKADLIERVVNHYALQEEEE